MIGLMKHTTLLSKQDLVDLLMASTNDQLSLFNGQLYEQTDGLAIGSPLGPLVANVFICSIEEILEREGKMPAYYGRYVDDTLTIMHDKTSADSFPEFLNHCHSSVKFTTEIENNGMLPFLGTQLSNKSTHIETKVYVKFTNTGLLLHYKSHVDDQYKRGLLKTTLDRAFRLSSTDPISLRNACDRLKLLLSRLKYPNKLINLIQQPLALLSSKYLINLLHRLTPMNQPPFALFFHFKSKAQLTIYGINLKTWARKFTSPFSLFL